MSETNPIPPYRKEFMNYYLDPDGHPNEAGLRQIAKFCERHNLETPRGWDIPAYRAQTRPGEHSRPRPRHPA